MKIQVTKQRENIRGRIQVAAWITFFVAFIAAGYYWMWWMSVGERWG